MSKRRKKINELDAYKLPSPVSLSALLHPGSGAHVESKEKRNKRTGRLKGAEKARFKRGDYDS
jgi:hypothetical protein